MLGDCILWYHFLLLLKLAPLAIRALTVLFLIPRNTLPGVGSTPFRIPDERSLKRQARMLWVLRDFPSCAALPFNRARDVANTVECPSAAPILTKPSDCQDPPPTFLGSPSAVTMSKGIDASFPVADCEP
jgi:hypothetical protein